MSKSSKKQGPLKEKANQRLLKALEKEGYVLIRQDDLIRMGVDIAHETLMKLCPELFDETSPEKCSSCRKDTPQQ